MPFAGRHGTVREEIVPGRSMYLLLRIQFDICIRFDIDRHADFGIIVKFTPSFARLDKDIYPSIRARDLQDIGLALEFGNCLDRPDIYGNVLCSKFGKVIAEGFVRFRLLRRTVTKWL